MATSRGPARYRIPARWTLLPVLCLVIAGTTACGQAAAWDAPAINQGATKPPAAPAAPSRNAEAPHGVTTPAPAPAVPSAPDGQAADECLRQRATDPVAGGMLECQYFTSGSRMPAGMPRAPGLSSGDYAVRFGSVGGRLLMTLRIPCAAYAVSVSMAGDTITPDPGTLESIVGTCTFPWDQEQARMERYIQAPLQVARREGGIVLHNPEWGVTLFRTPYEAD